MNIYRALHYRALHYEYKIYYRALRYEFNNIMNIFVKHTSPLSIFDVGEQVKPSVFYVY